MKTDDQAKKIHLDEERAYEILMNVFRQCNVEPPEDCHKYFETDSKKGKEE